MTIKHELRKLLWSFGLDLQRFDRETHPVARRRHLMQRYGIQVVLDVGANIGQYGQNLRDEMLYTGRLCSFEPMSKAFAALQARAAGDAQWQVFNFALGDADGRQTINIAGNSYSSSMLDMLPAHEQAAPESKFVGKEEIVIRTLDGVFPEVCKPGERIYLKVDTQGFEGRVLKGGERALGHIDTVQMEMSLTPLYAGEASFNDLCQTMQDKGYTLVALEPGFTDPRTGHLLQMDGIFHRDR